MKNQPIDSMREHKLRMLEHLQKQIEIFDELDALLDRVDKYIAPRLANKLPFGQSEELLCECASALHYLADKYQPPVDRQGGEAGSDRK
jgi:hypothetical protein